MRNDWLEIPGNVEDGTLVDPCFHKPDTRDLRDVPAAVFGHAFGVSENIGKAGPLVVGGCRFLKCFDGCQRHDQQCRA
ncbi:hypothetical protein D9M70_494640 [compost metagenome]